MIQVIFSGPKLLVLPVQHTFKDEISTIKPTHIQAEPRAFFQGNATCFDCYFCQ